MRQTYVCATSEVHKMWKFLPSRIDLFAYVNVL